MVLLLQVLDQFIPDDFLAYIVAAHQFSEGDVLDEASLADPAGIREGFLLILPPRQEKFSDEQDQRSQAVGQFTSGRAGDAGIDGDLRDKGVGDFLDQGILLLYDLAGNIPQHPLPLPR